MLNVEERSKSTEFRFGVKMQVGQQRRPPVAGRPKPAFLHQLHLRPRRLPAGRFGILQRKAQRGQWGGQQARVILVLTSMMHHVTSARLTAGLPLLVLPASHWRNLEQSTRALSHGEPIRHADHTCQLHSIAADRFVRCCIGMVNSTTSRGTVGRRAPRKTLLSPPCEHAR